MRTYLHDADLDLIESYRVCKVCGREKHLHFPSTIARDHRGHLCNTWEPADRFVVTKATLEHFAKIAAIRERNRLNDIRAATAEATGIPEGE